MIDSTIEFLTVHQEIVRTTVPILSLLIVIVGTFLVLRQMKMSRDAKFTELWLEAEKDFVELNKLMLTDKRLRDSYRNNDPVLKAVDDAHLRKFIFYELYYSHLSRAHRMFESPLNPYHGGKEAKSYWELYQPIIKYYAKDPVFREVHNSAKAMKTFSKEFVKVVDEIVADTKIKKRKQV